MRVLDHAPLLLFVYLSRHKASLLPASLWIFTAKQEEQQLWEECGRRFLLGLSDHPFCPADALHAVCIVLELLDMHCPMRVKGR